MEEKLTSLAKYLFEEAKEEKKTIPMKTRQLFAITSIAASMIQITKETKKQTEILCKILRAMEK